MPASTVTEGLRTPSGPSATSTLNSADVIPASEEAIGYVKVSFPQDDLFDLPTGTLISHPEVDPDQQPILNRAFPDRGSSYDWPRPFAQGGPSCSNSTITACRSVPQKVAPRGLPEKGGLEWTSDDMNLRNKEQYLRCPTRA